MDKRILKGVYAITPVLTFDDEFRSTKALYLQWLDEMLDAEIKLIQFRPKTVDGETRFSDAERKEIAQAMKEKAEKHGAYLVVNDDAHLAFAIDAGLHLGQRDLKESQIAYALKVKEKGHLVGVSVSNERELNKAFNLNAGRERLVPDYLGVSTGFKTTSKKDFKSGDMLFLEHVAKSHGHHLRVFAIGGIKEENLRQVMRTGFVHGVAAIGSVSTGPQAASFKDSFELARRHIPGKRL
ncbi:MAG: thiamine phosphate synthase [Candidatus Micrarchaeota archaeon]